MKWFKHMTNAFRDEKIQRLYNVHGMAGIGRFWVLVEAIAEHMNESDKCELTYTKSMWAKVLAIPSPTALSTYLSTLSSTGLVTLHQEGDQLCCSIPNLLKIRARKKPIESKNVTQNRIEVEKEIRTPIVPKGTDVEFENFWKEYPARNGTKAGKVNAMKQFQKLNALERAKTLHAIKMQKQHYEACKKKGVFVSEFPDAFRWLRDKKFNDEVQTTLLNGSGAPIDHSIGDWVRIMRHIEAEVESASVDGISETGSKALEKVGGLMKVRSVHKQHIHFVQNDFKEAFTNIMRASK